MSKILSRRQLLKYGLAGSVGGLVAARLPAVQPATAAPAGATTLAQGMSQAAIAFLDALDAGQRGKATYAFADQERFRWHWTTPGGFPRNGLPLREMNSDQRALALALLQASVSEAGYTKALNIIALQKDLGNDPDLYYVTVFGTPGTSAPWGWRIEGHHLSHHYAIVGEQVSVTPFFLGAWPTVTDAGLRAMDREEQAARELVSSLDDAKRAVAIFQQRTLTRHVTWNAVDVKPLDLVGLPYGDMGADQRALVNEILRTYTGVLPDALGTFHLECITEAGIENVRFGWAGPLEPRRPHYYRLQGPTFLLEFDCSRNGGTHIHSVWRDFTHDWGYHLL